MKIDRFNEVITDQLSKLGGEVQATITPEERGYYVTLHIGEHGVSKFYGDNAVATYAEPLVRVQVTHLYKQLSQNVIDTILGEGKINVI